MFLFVSPHQKLLLLLKEHSQKDTKKKQQHIMGVSKNNGTLKSSILIGFSIINHPFWGTPILGNIHIDAKKLLGLELENDCQDFVVKIHQLR